MERQISEFPITLAFKSFLQNKSAGTLEVSGNGITRTLHIYQGHITDASSTHEEESLSAVLRGSGLFSGDKIIDDDEEFCSFLLQRKIIQPGEINFVRLHRIRMIALSVVTLTEGTWKFSETRTENRSPRTGHFIHLVDVLSDGVSRSDYPELFKEIFCHYPPEFLEINPETEANLYERQLKYLKEMHILSTRTHQEIMTRLSVPEKEYWELLSLFYLTNCVEFFDLPSDRQTSRNRDKLLAMHQLISEEAPDLYRILEISHDASFQEIKDAFFAGSRIYHPDSLGLTPDTEIYNIANQVFSKINEAYDILSNPDRKAEYDRRHETSPDDTEENPQKQARILFARSMDNFRKKKYAEAAEILKKAVHLDSSKAKYFLQLGMVQIHISTRHRDAEKNLKKAAAMEPWNAEPLYALGVLYKSENLEKMSEKSFRRALEINMDHTRAGRALLNLSKKKDLKKSLLKRLK